MIVPHRRCLLQQRMHKVIVAMCLDSSLASLQVPVCKATHFVCFCSSWLDVLPQFLSTLLHVNPSKASGPDNIPNIILKTFAESIVHQRPPFSDNLWKLGYFPWTGRQQTLHLSSRRKTGTKLRTIAQFHWRQSLATCLSILSTAISWPILRNTTYSQAESMVSDLATLLRLSKKVSCWPLCMTFYNPMIEI